MDSLASLGGFLILVTALGVVLAMMTPGNWRTAMWFLLGTGLAGGALAGDALYRSPTRRVRIGAEGVSFAVDSTPWAAFPWDHVTEVRHGRLRGKVPGRLLVGRWRRFRYFWVKGDDGRALLVSGAHWKTTEGRLKDAVAAVVSHATHRGIRAVEQDVP